MSAVTPKSVEEQLNLSAKQVDLMLMIDTVCDNAEDDIAALLGAVSLISQALEAEVGLLSWFDPDTQALELRSLVDRIGVLTPANHAELFRLSQAACALPAIQPVPAAVSAAEVGSAALAGRATAGEGSVIGRAGVGQCGATLQRG